MKIARFIIFWLFDVVLGAIVYRNSGLQIYRSQGFVNNSANLISYSVTNELICIYICLAAKDALCFALQYNTNSGLCTIASGCILLQLQPDLSSTTYALHTAYAYTQALIVKGSVLPTPIFDWMMTSTCGFNNTGSLLNGLPLYPQNYGSSTVWNFTYMPSPNSYMGSAVLYVNQLNNIAITPFSNFSIDLVSQSLTIFAYYWLNSVSRFVFLEFGFRAPNGGYTFSAHFWRESTGFYQNYCLLGASNCGLNYDYTLTMKSWTYVALVHNLTTRRFTHYLNGVPVVTGNVATFPSIFTNLNYVTTVGRPSSGYMDGTTYCLKVYYAALTADQIRTIAAACFGSAV